MPTLLPATREPYAFDEYFALGLTESASPFLTPSSRHWAQNLSLKTSLFSAGLFVFALLLYFHPAALPLSYLLLLGVYILAGIPSLIDSIEDILRLEINIDVLMTVAAFASAFLGSPLEGALLLVLFDISGAMEHAVEEKAKTAVNTLYKLSPTKALVLLEDGEIQPRSVKDISLGAKILIKAGEIVPLDGIVLEGITSVNLVHLTGESLPQKKQSGDVIQAGAANLEGSVILEVTHTTGNSTLAKIIRLITEAQEARPKIQRWFESVSQTYATLIISLSALFALGLPWMIGISYLGQEGSIYRALAFLIAASPCALIIAIPIAYLSAVSSCARRGILVKGGMTLDALAACRTIAFDKTGTLTTGQLQCISFEPIYTKDPLDEAAVLAAARGLEANAIHPIAAAIETYAASRNITSSRINEFAAVPGYGLQGSVKINTQNVPVYIGNPEFLLDKVSPEQQQALQAHQESLAAASTLLALMKLGENLYLFRFEDTPRPAIKEALLSLKRYCKVLMLTGDHLQSAQKMAGYLGIDQVFADLRPEDKLRIVSSLAEKEGLAMVGDGINDAPALARATVGIGMGKVGSATAIAAADIVLLQDNLELMEWLLHKAKQTKAIVRQNLGIAFGVIILATTPALMGLVPLWAAVLLHEGGTVLVGLNALRLLKK